MKKTITILRILKIAAAVLLFSMIGLGIAWFVTGGQNIFLKIAFLEVGVIYIVLVIVGVRLIERSQGERF